MIRAAPQAGTEKIMTGHEHAEKSQASLRQQETGFSERARKGQGKLLAERSIAQGSHNVKTTLGKTGQN
jgi:hypothetical protein